LNQKLRNNNNEVSMEMKIGIFLFGFLSASCVGILLARLMVVQSAKILESAESDLAELYSQFQSKQILNLTIYAVIAMILFGFILTRNIVIALIFGVCGYFIPRLLLKRQQSKRLNAFNKQLVSAVDLMANSLKSGFSLPQAFEMITKEMKPPISQEFEMVVKENRMGIPLEEALINLQKRMQSEELDLIVTAINIGRETGGNLAEIFGRMAKTIRDKDIMLGKIRALTSEGKMQGIFVGALPIILGLALTLIDPEMMRPMFTTTIGYILLGLVVFLEVIGAIFIKKIITVDV